jgi:hypothetical protein
LVWQEASVEWWGPSRRIEQIDHGEELLIRVTSIRRKGDLVVIESFCGVGLVISLASGSWAWALGSVSFALIGWWGWSRESVTELLVNEQGAESRGNTGWTDTSASVRWAKVFKLRYEAGGEDSPSGLCARTSRWFSTRLVEGVDAAQSAEIIAAIYKRFPLLRLAPEPDGFIASFTKAYRAEK